MSKKTFSGTAIVIMLTIFTFGMIGASQSISSISTKEVLGFYTNQEGVSYNNKIFNLDSSFSTVMENNDKISIVVPFWFKLNQSGKGGILFDRSSFSSEQPEQEAINAVRQMKEKNVKVLGLIHNMLYGNSGINGKELAHQVLANESSRNNFIEQVRKIIDKYDLDGINIDIENVYKSDRDNYTQLIKELKEKIGTSGYIITVSIPAKTFDNSNDSFSYPFNYKGIAQYADRVAIMTYDEHGAWEGSGPGPIASIPWQEQVVNYALTQMPKEKIMLGIPVYGFDWTQGKSWPKYSSYQMSMDTANEKGIDVQWNDEAKVPYFKYSDETGNREVWFENAQSFEEKISLIYKYDLDGIAIWRLGMEDSQIWDIITERINVDKIIFGDINGHWAKDQIIQLYKDGYVKGCSYNCFNPGGNLTRAEFIAMIARVLNITEPSSSFITKFKDSGLNNHWAKSVIMAMEEKGYISGVEDSRGDYYINPNQQITRAEMITMLYNVMGKPQDEIYNSNFYDIQGHWAEKAIKSMEGMNLIMGIKLGVFGPDQTCTRAEAVVIIQRYLEYMKR